MFPALRALVIASLLYGGLFCPSQSLMASSAEQCGNHADHALLRASADVMPCCLENHRADSPVTQPDLLADVISVSLPVFAPIEDGGRLDSGCLDRWQKYRDKFEEGYCGKRE